MFALFQVGTIRDHHDRSRFLLGTIGYRDDRDANQLGRFHQLGKGLLERSEWRPT